MTRFAFVTWDGGGNVPPAIGIAQELLERGHDVVFIGYEVQRAEFERRHMSFVTLAESGRFDIYATTDPAARLAGLMSQVWACPDHVHEVAAAAQAVGADVVVVDFLMQGALASLTRMRLPWAALAHSSVAGLTPPPESPMGVARLAATNRLRSVVRLPLLDRLADAWAGYPTIVTTIPALDPAAESAASSVRYVGPIFERLADETWASPWQSGDDRPLVLVSFTTTRLWDQTGRIRNTLTALAGDDVRVLVSAAQAMELGPVPGNAAIRTFVPHRRVLPFVAATVSHGGHGTVAASLADGVPLVALPNQAADQPFLAARVQQLGAGLAVDGESGPAAIRVAVRSVLEDPSFRAAAGRLGDAIRSTSGAVGAATSLERLARRAVDHRPSEIGDQEVV
ncbi:MAG: glycosyltransferase [Candidatus Limnocylindrales bacterium]